MERRAISPKMIVLGRQSRGLTQSQLAKKAGIPQARISKIESGLVDVSAEALARIAKALDYPEAFFTDDDELYGIDTSILYHRKRESLGAKILDKVHALINIRRKHIAKLLQGAELQPSKHFPQFDLDEFEGRADQIAQAVRAAWVLPRGPIDNVTKAVEDAGGIIIRFDFETRLIDAISQWVPGFPPLFFVNKDVPGDRLRFSLAHELGHVVMHPKRLTPDSESEADRFAANFLMPADQIRSHLLHVDIAKLAELKPYWKVAMSALLKRATDLGTITERHARTMWMRFNKAGYRLREPAELDIPVEEPRTLGKLLSFHRGALEYSVGDLARMLRWQESEVRSTYFGQQPFRAVR